MAQVQVKDGNGNLTTAALVTNTGQTTMVNSLPVTLASDQTAIGITDVTPDATTTGSLTTVGVVGTQDTGAIKVNSEGSYTVVIKLTGTWVGTVSFYQTIDGTTYDAIKGVSITGGGSVSSTTANGEWVFNVGGFKEIWAVMTSYTSGTATTVLNSSIAQQSINANVYGASAEGSAPSYPPIYISGKDASGNKRGLLLDTSGAVALATSAIAPLQQIAGLATLHTNFSQVINPPSTYLITSAGSGSANSVTAKVLPGGTYAFSISLPATAAAALSMASSTTTIGSAVVSYTGTSPTIGSLVAGTGVAPGSYVVSVIAATSFTMSLPATANGTVTLTSTGGTFTVNFEGSADNSNWSAINVVPKTVQTLTTPISSTSTIGLYTYDGSDNTIQYIRARLSSLTTITQVQMHVDAVVPNKSIRMPFISGVAANVPVNTCVVPPIDVSDLGEFTLDVNANTSYVLAFRQSSDPLLALATTNNCNGVLVSATNQLTTQTVASSATGLYRISPRAQYFWVIATTATTSFGFGGVTASVAPKTADAVTCNTTSASAFFSLGQIGTTGVTTGGANGSLGVGGIVAQGALVTQNPLVIGAVDTSTQVKRLQSDPLGALQIVGAGESVTQFSLTAASGTPADGTNSKTIVVPRVEADFYIGFSSIGSSTGFQVEYSYDNITYTTMPVARVDNTAISQVIGGLYSPFVPISGAIYRGKTYGAPFIRIHNMSGGGTPNGMVRVVPCESNSMEQSVSAWTFSTAGIIEAAGTANGTAAIGSMRTMQIPVKGSMKARLNVDAMMSTGQLIVLEGSVDGTNYTSTLQLSPLAGGNTVTACVSGANTTTAQPTIGVFETDVSGFASVRARMGASGAGTTTATVAAYAHGALKLIPVQSNRLSVGVTTSAVASFTTTFPAVSMAVAANPNRRLVVLKNEGAGTLYYGFGSSTSALTSTSYTDIVAPGDSAWLANINQQVNISFGAAGTARVTELM